jgi:hypothetical protein
MCDGPSIDWPTANDFPVMPNTRMHFLTYFVARLICIFSRFHPRQHILKRWRKFTTPFPPRSRHRAPCQRS